MTKEEIREGINERIGDCLIEIGCGAGGCPKAEMVALEAQEKLLDTLLQYLHENGVVILYCNDERISKFIKPPGYINKKLLKDYVQIESLI